MAKKSNTGIRDIINDIRKGNPAQVYILTGEEPYYLDLITENLEAHVIPEGDRDFNLTLFYGQDADIDYVIAAARQFPVMADRRLVILKEAQSMDRAKVQLERLAPYIENPAPNTVFALVFKDAPFAATSKIMKAAKASGATVFTSNLPRDYELLGHARDYCTERRISIEEKALQLMCEYVGAPLSKLFGEIAKLSSICGTRRITAEDVERNTGRSREYSAFDFSEALAQKNYTKAIRIVSYLEGLGSKSTGEVIKYTGVVFALFSNVIAAHYLADKSDASMMDAFGYKWPGQLKSLKEAMRNYPPVKALNAIHHLRDFDTRSKGIDSMTGQFPLLREMVFKFFT